MKANQGVFYLLRGEGEDQVLELAASYAYGKRKHTDGKVTISAGTGLLGQCIKEKDIIFLSQIPKGYIKITSGLGEITAILSHTYGMQLDNLQFQPYFEGYADNICQWSCFTKSGRDLYVAFRNLAQKNNVFLLYALSQQTCSCAYRYFSIRVFALSISIAGG